MINNACATQAIISCLLNLDQDQVKKEGVEIGPTLGGFKEFTSSFDPGLKGLSLSNSEEIRTVHNSFSRQSIFEFDDIRPPKDDEDVFHFVTYVPIGGRIYELDGLREGPLDHGRIPENSNDWLEGVKPVIEQRMAKYQAGEIHFNLMAVVKDKVAKIEDEIAAMTAAGGEIGHLQMDLEMEKDRRKSWKKENIRRRHNYLPFIMELLKFLGSEGQLVNVYDKAKEKSLALQKKKDERKKAAS